MVSIATLIALIVTSAACAEPLGELSLQDLYYRPVTLGSLAGAPATVLFFYANTCPVARRYMPRIAQIEADYRARGLRCVAINVSPADTILDVADHAFSYDVAFPVVKDTDFSVVRALNVTRTPEVVLLDADLAVRYQGRVDDQYRLGGARHEVGRRDLVEALDAVLAGEEVAVPQTQAEGCIVTFPLPPTPDRNVTYERDIQPVVSEHCVSCHQSDGAAPFSLESKAAIDERKDAISRVIRDGQMPPWHATIENPWLTSRQLSFTLQHRLRGWLSGPMPPAEAATIPPGPAPRFDRTFRPNEVEPTVLHAGTIEVALGPALEAGIWIKRLQLQADRTVGLLNATVYYQEGGERGQRRYLCGPLLIGQQLGWGEKAAMFVPAGAVLGLGVRFESSAPDTVALNLGLETVAEPPADAVACFALSTTRASDDQFRVVLAIPAGTRLHSIAASYPDYNVAVVSDFYPADGPTQRVLTVPAFDPRWPLRYPVAKNPDVSGEGGQLKAELSFPQYFTPPLTPPSPGAEFALFATVLLDVGVTDSAGVSHVRTHRE